MQFHRLDLNLLVVFRALMVHRSLTRVAGELGLTQPAISHALKRLRMYYDDDLFSRNGNRMEPTAKAIELNGPINDALNRIYSTFEGEIDPHTIDIEIKVGFVEYASVFFQPILVQLFRDQAPGVKVISEEMKSEVALEFLASGRIDLVIGDLLGERSDIRRTPLFREPYVAVTGNAKPLADCPLTLEQFVTLRHIKLPIYRRVRDHLARLGAELDYAAEASNVLSVPSMVSRSDYVAIVPKTFADVFRQLHDVREIKIAFELPEVVVDAAHDFTRSEDPVHRWVSSCIESVGTEIREKLAAKAMTEWNS